VKENPNIKLVYRGGECNISMATATYLGILRFPASPSTRWNICRYHLDTQHLWYRTGRFHYTLNTGPILEKDKVIIV